MAILPRALAKLCVAKSGFSHVRHLTNRPNVPAMTIQEFIDKIYVKVGTDPIWSPGSENRQLLAEYVPRKQDGLPARTMQESYSEVILPFSSDSQIRDKYMTFRGGVRFGRLLEDLDVFAAYLGLQHVKIPNLPPDTPTPVDVVTALVDQIDLRDKVLSAKHDLKVCGFVSWVGSSSIECTINVVQQFESKWEHMLEARFVMVATDPLQMGKVVVNPLVPGNEEEKKIMKEGQERSNLRKQLEAQNLLRTPPSADEMSMIHKIFLSTIDSKGHTFKARVKPEGYEWMEKHKLKNLLVCHPQHRNRYNKIFGGFLMRQAFELGWALGYVSSKSRPILVMVDDIWFRKPVEIGSLLYLLAQVVYGGGDTYVIRVSAEVMKPQEGSWETTNVFYFIFKFPEAQSPLPHVIPRTYSDAMLYLDGKRHFECVMGSK